MSDKKQGHKPEMATTLHCKVKGCKHSPSKFEFCAEHFDQFKFGLINKQGEHCADYEKKLDQYEHKKAHRKAG